MFAPYTNFKPYFHQFRGLIQTFHKAIITPLENKYLKTLKSLFLFSIIVSIYDISSSLFTKKSLFFINDNLTSNIYKEKCFQNRALSRIGKHRGPTLFWPDLTSCEKNMMNIRGKCLIPRIT